MLFIKNLLSSRTRCDFTSNLQQALLAWERKSVSRSAIASGTILWLIASSRTAIEKCLPPSQEG